MKTTLILIVILTLGAFLRLFWLESYPPGVTGDEIQQAYTGYSILKTGKDEWGDFLPINPRGFGDYKPPLYAYLTIPFEALLGLNIFAARLPSAIAGILTIFITYFLAKELFEKKYLALLATFFLAISSWHIQYSRIAWESNVGVMFFSLGALFLLKSFKNNKLLILSSLFFGITLFTYHSFKLFTLLFLFSFIFFYRKKLNLFNKKYLILSAVLLLIFTTIVAHGVLFSGSGRRGADAAIYSQENLGLLREIQVEDKLPQPWGRVLNSRVQYISSQFIQNYLGYYSTTFLFSPYRSDSTLFNLPGEGLLYIWQIVVFFAIYLFIKYKPKWLYFTLIWFLAAPIPAALTKEYMHAQRVQTFLPLISLLSAYSIYFLWERIKNKRLEVIALTVFLIICLGSLIGRIDYYLYHQFNKPLGGIKFGYMEVVNFVEERKQKYDQIIFTKRNSEPQAFVAFYSQMDPVIFQQYSKDWKYFEVEGFKFLDMINYSMGKYQFRNINWDSDEDLKNTLIVATPDEVANHWKSIKIIKDLSGKDIFLVFDTNDIKKEK